MVNLIFIQFAKRGLITIGCLLLSLALNAYAQTETGQIIGKVAEPQDRFVPCPKISVKSVDIGYMRDATTDEQGRYVITNLFVTGVEADMSSSTIVPTHRLGRRNLQLAAKFTF